jgi:hypothetical protein
MGKPTDKYDLVVILAIVVELFDFAATEWMFSHEPSLTDEAVRKCHLALLPGTLFFRRCPPCC